MNEGVVSLGNSVQLPRLSEFYNPVLQAVHHLGGEGSNAEIVNQVVSFMRLTNEQLSVTYEDRNNNKTKVEDRIGWARSHLKIAGLLDTPRRSYWTLTELGRRTRSVNPADISRAVRDSRADSGSPSQRRGRRSSPSTNEPLLSVHDFYSSSANWRDELAGIIHGLSPRQIQQLLLRLFHADGMQHIETLPSGGSADLDGFMASGGGLLNLRIAFRFLRGGHLTSADDLDNFRSFTAKSGAVNGILFSTAGFTGEAERFASTGTPRIELYDLDRLSDSLMQMSLGIGTEIVRVERVTIDKAFFDSL